MSGRSRCARAQSSTGPRPLSSVAGMGSSGARTPPGQAGPAGVGAANPLTNLSVFRASIPAPATGLNVLPQGATVPGHGSGNLPASPSSPVPATPATPGGLPDSGGCILAFPRTLEELDDKPAEFCPADREALVAAGHFGRTELVRELLDALAVAIRAVAGADLERVLQQSLRALRRIGLRHEIAELLASAETAIPTGRADALRGRLALASGLAFLGDSGRALPIYDQARKALGESMMLTARLELSMILISHDLSVIAEVCDEVAVMYAGKIVETGPTASIFAPDGAGLGPAHPYTARLRHAFPAIRRARTFVEAIAGSPPDLLAPPPGCRFADRCDIAIDICRADEPELLEVGPGHAAACHRSALVLGRSA